MMNELEEILYNDGSLEAMIAELKCIAVTKDSMIRYKCSLDDIESALRKSIIRKINDSKFG